MKKIVTVIFLVLTLSLFLNLKVDAINSDDDCFEDCSNTELLVGLTNEASKVYKNYSISDFSAVNCIEVKDLTKATFENKNINNTKFKRILKLTFSNKIDDFKHLINKIEQYDFVEYAEPNYKLYNLDTFFESNTRTQVDIDWPFNTINIVSARNLIQNVSRQNTYIGVVDRGISYSSDPTATNYHSQLVNSVYYPASRSYQDNVDPHIDESFESHGTFVAGIIGATIDGIGVDGMSSNNRIVSYKHNATKNIYNDFSEEWSNVDTLVTVINKAAEQNFPRIKVLNISLGARKSSNSLRTAINYFNGLVVCGAGNDNKNNDNESIKFYPASFDLPNIISVGAIDSNLSRWTVSSTLGSCYGKTTVDVFAPGKDIYSTIKGGGYAYNSGTSFACAYVSGLAGMIFSIEENITSGYFTPIQVKNIIMNSVTTTSELSNLCVSGGYINAYAALNMALDCHNNNISNYYDDTYHTKQCGCGDSYLEEHQWVRVVSKSVNELFAVGNRVFRCISCGVTKFQ